MASTAINPLKPGKMGAFGLGAYVAALESGLSDEEIKRHLPTCGLVVGERVQRILGVDVQGNPLTPCSECGRANR